MSLHEDPHAIVQKKIRHHRDWIQNLASGETICSSTEPPHQDTAESKLQKTVDILPGDIPGMNLYLVGKSNQIIIDIIMRYHVFTIS